MRKILLLFIPLLFVACNQESIERTKELNKNNPLLKDKIAAINSSTQDNREIQKNQIDVTKGNSYSEYDLKRLETQNIQDLERIKAQHKERLEEIKAQKEMKIKELETQKEIQKALALKEQKAIEANTSLLIAKLQSKTQIETTKEMIYVYKMVAIVTAVVILIWLMFYYINKASKRTHEAALKEKELQVKAQLEEEKLREQNIAKMLEIISDKDEDSEVKKEVAKLLTQLSTQTKLLEYKKS